MLKMLPMLPPYWSSTPLSTHAKFDRQKTEDGTKKTNSTGKKWNTAQFFFNSTGAWVSKTPAIFDTREIRQAKNGRWHKKNKFDRQKMEYGTIFFQFDRGVGVESGVELQ